MDHEGQDSKRRHYTRPVSPASVTGASGPPSQGQKHPPLRGELPGAPKNKAALQAPEPPPPVGAQPSAPRRPEARGGLPGTGRRTGSSATFAQVTVPRRPSRSDHSSQ
ncbi:hypothetical protein HispidOSU_003740 [Sigmodon hispidus]